MDIFDKVARAGFMKDVQRPFEAAGWTFAPPGNGVCDFQATKQGITYTIECIDSSVASYIPPVRIFEKLLQGRKGDLRAKRLSHLVLFDESYRKFDFTAYIAGGTAMLLRSDLDLAVSLPRYFSDWPENILPVERLLIEQCVSLSLSISDRYHEAGNVEQAMHWAQRAMKIHPVSQYPYRRLIAYLEAAGRPFDAEEIAEKALIFHAKDASFRRVMERAARLRKDEVAMRKWAPLPKDVAESSTSFLLNRQKRPMSDALAKELQDEPKPRAKGWFGIGRR